MKALESFTICPSKGLSADSKENGDSNVPSFLHNKRSSFRPIQRGTVLQNWNGSKDSFSLDRDAGRVIRASPFEPGIHDRNFPKSGTISPLNSEEYQAWKNREGTVNNIKESPHSSPPQIMQKPQASGIDIVRVTGCFPDVCSKRENSDVSWETRFLKSEVERTQMSEKLMAVIEENRTLRIETISLSAALFCEKNKTRKASVQMNDVKINNEDPLVCYEDEQKCNSDVAEKSTTCFSKVTAHKKVSLPSSNDQRSESDEFMIYNNNKCDLVCEKEIIEMREEEPKVDQKSSSLEDKQQDSVVSNQSATYGNEMMFSSTESQSESNTSAPCHNKVENTGSGDQSISIQECFDMEQTGANSRVNSRRGGACVSSLPASESALEISLSQSNRISHYNSIAAPAVRNTPSRMAQNNTGTPEEDLEITQKSAGLEDQQNCTNEIPESPSITIANHSAVHENGVKTESYSSAFENAGDDMVCGNQSDSERKFLDTEQKRPNSDDIHQGKDNKKRCTERRITRSRSKRNCEQPNETKSSPTDSVFKEDRHFHRMNIGQEKTNSMSKDLSTEDSSTFDIGSINNSTLCLSPIETKQEAVERSFDSTSVSSKPVHQDNHTGAQVHFHDLSRESTKENLGSSTINKSNSCSKSTNEKEELSKSGKRKNKNQISLFDKFQAPTLKNQRRRRR